MDLPQQFNIRYGNDHASPFSQKIALLQLPCCFSGMPKASNQKPMNLAASPLIAKLILTIALLTSAITSAQQNKANRSLEPLRNQLENIRSSFPGDMSIFMKNLSTKDEIGLDSDSVYETFSVIKLAIAAELMHQVELGKFNLSDRISTKAENERLPSGVLYTLDPGLNPTVKDLLTLMIINQRQRSHRPAGR
jgi:beta-lactamase class A